MRVNIIGALTKGTGVSQDIHILHGLIAHVMGENTTIRRVPHYFPQCDEADINFFVEVINPALFYYAGKNIWIPNPEWTYKTWEPYAHMVDEIWVKTHEAEKLFQEWSVPVRYIGWTSIDKAMPERKNYHKAIVPVGKNIWRNPVPIIQSYMHIQKRDPSLFKSIPELHIVYNPKAVPLAPIPEELQTKIKLHSEFMNETEYNELLHECGLCICLSAAEGFGHAVNEAMAAGCNLLLSPIDAYRELTDTCFWTSMLKSTPHPQCISNLEDVDIGSVVEALILYTSSQFLLKKSYSENVRKEYEKRHEAFVERMSAVLKELADTTEEYSGKDRLPKEEDLPAVSIITITRDRRPFIPLAKYNLLAQAYPENKLEWVIVDDGKDQIKDLVSEIPNVKYILADEPMTIGAKRNLGIQWASHDIFVMMDDDDIYPNHSVLSRVAHLLMEPKKECIFSTTIPCYQIHDKKSFMNVPPITLPMSQRVSEATLCFTRNFWMDRKFPDQQIAEGDAFIQGREQMCRELSPQDVIVSLVHNKNSSSRKPPQMEQNGCHYGFSDELFTLVSEIALSLEENA
jgi:glycosyltransferase involved in cell wall biosynthesis